MSNSHPTSRIATLTLKVFAYLATTLFAICPASAQLTSQSHGNAEDLNNLMRQRKENLNAVSHRIKSNQNRFTITPDFISLPSTAADPCLRTDTLIRLVITDSDFVTSLTEKERPTAELIEVARKLNSEWTTAFQSAITAGQMERLDRFERELQSFQESLNEHYGDTPPAFMGDLIAQHQSLQFGLEDYLSSMNPEAYSDSRAKLTSVGESHRKKTTQLLLEQIDKLLPGYLTEAELRTIPDDMSFPIEAILARLKSSPTNDGNVLQRLDKEIQLQAWRGEWVYDGTQFSRTPTGEVVLAPSISHQIPIHTSIEIFFNNTVDSLTPQQEDDVRQILGQQRTSMGSNPSPPTLEQEFLDWVIHNKRLSWAQITTILLPHQLAEVTSRAKLFNFINLGPRILRQLSQEDLASNEVKFEENLQDFIEALDNCAASSKSELIGSLSHLFNRDETSFLRRPARPTVFYSYLASLKHE